jgi:hypothetical protein
MDQVLASILQQGMGSSRLRRVEDYEIVETKSAPAPEMKKAGALGDLLIEELKSKRPVLRPVDSQDLPEACGGQRPPAHVVEELEMEQGKRPVHVLKELRMKWHLTNTQGEQRVAVDKVKQRLHEDPTFESHLRQIRERREKLFGDKEKVTKMKLLMKQEGVPFTRVPETAIDKSMPHGMSGVWIPSTHRTATSVRGMVIPPPPPPPPAVLPSDANGTREETLQSDIFATLKKQKNRSLRHSMPPSILTTATTGSPGTALPVSTSPVQRRNTTAPRMSSTILNNPVRNTLMEHFRLKSEQAQRQLASKSVFKPPAPKVQHTSGGEDEYMVVSKLQPQGLNGNEHQRASSSWLSWFW